MIAQLPHIPDIVETGPRNVTGRLREWKRVRSWNPLNAFPKRSPNGKIVDEQSNAGVHGSGVVFDVIDGVSCRPDGGMAAYCERYESALRQTVRMMEVSRAIRDLTRKERRVVLARYLVEKRERPRTREAAAERLGIPLSTFGDHWTSAVKHLAQILDLWPH